MTKQLALAVMMIVGGIHPLTAQTKVTSRAPAAKATDMSGPASLVASASSYGVWLRFPPVSRAVSYRITRINNKGDAEKTIFEGLAAYFTFEGNTCTVGSVMPNCVFMDKNPIANTTHTYRVWSIFVTANGPVASPPSPPARVQWR